ncbi:MAG: hypothetical protein MJZ61_01295 [Bacteroidales bacterium]|nr:hypothetical protein [Bacteroidales bacterium]
MKKSLVSLLVLMISGLADIANGQDFKSADAMVGHRVYFKELCSRADVFELIMPVVDGKYKPLKPKQQPDYPEIRDLKTIYKVNGLVADKNSQYLDLKSGDRNYYLKIADLKSGSKNDIYKTAVNYDVYELRYQDYKNNYHYLNTNYDKSLFKNAGPQLLLDVYAKVEWENMSIGDDKEVYATLKAEGCDNPLSIRIDDLRTMLLHNSKVKEYKAFENKVKNEYRNNYKHLDVTAIKHNHIDSSKIVLNYFYPIEITKPSLDSNYKMVIGYRIEGKDFFAKQEDIDSGIVSNARMTIYKNHFDSYYTMRNQYHYFDISGLENLHIDNDSILCEKYYPITVLEADLNKENNLIYRIMLGADKKGFKKSTFLIRAKTDQQMEAEIKAYEERLEAERRAQEKRKEDEEFFNKYLKGAMFYRQCTITQYLGNQGEAALIGMMFGIGYNNAIIVTEGYAFRDMYHGVDMSQGDVDLNKVPRDVINKGGLGQLYQFAKALDVNSEFESERDGNTIYITINGKTHPIIFDPKTRTIKDGDNVYKYQKID